MTTLLSKLPRSHSPAEAEDDVPETSPFSIVVVGVAVLLLGDVAVTLAAIATMG